MRKYRIYTGRDGKGGNVLTAGAGFLRGAVGAALFTLIICTLLFSLSACSGDGAQSGEVSFGSSAAAESGAGIYEGWCGEYSGADYSAGESDGMPLTVYLISDDEGEYLRFSFGTGDDYYAFTVSPSSYTFTEVVKDTALTFTLNGKGTIEVTSDNGEVSAYTGIYHTGAYWSDNPTLDPESVAVSESWLGEYAVYDGEGTPVKWLTVSDAADAFAPYKVDMTFSGSETLYMLSETPEGNTIITAIGSARLTLTLTDEGINAEVEGGEDFTGGFYVKIK